MWRKPTVYLWQAWLSCLVLRQPKPLLGVKTSHFLVSLQTTPSDFTKWPHEVSRNLLKTLVVGSIEFMLSQSTVDVQEPSVIIQFYSCKYGYHKAVDLKIKTSCISVNKYCHHCDVLIDRFLQCRPGGSPLHLLHHIDILAHLGAWIMI